MKPGTRRFVTAAAVFVALLFIGSWVSSYLSERWWAASISPEAADFFSRWQRRGILLDGLAILVASIWFCYHVFKVIATIHENPIPQKILHLTMLDWTIRPFLRSTIFGLGLLLGWIGGVGAHSWLGPLVLALHRPEWPVTTQAVTIDVGNRIALLPLIRLLLDFGLTIVLLALAFSITVYLVAKAISRHQERRTWRIHPSARDHLGRLTLNLATLILIHVMIERQAFRIGAALPNSGTSGSWLYSVAATAALLTGYTCWQWRQKKLNGATLLSAWGILCTCLLLLHLANPTERRDARIPKFREAFTAAAWGVQFETADGPAQGPITAVWDESILASQVRATGGLPLRITPGTANDLPVWLSASLNPDGAMLVERIQEGVIATDGSPAKLPPEVWISRPRVYPQAPAWKPVEDGGVVPSNFLARLVIAWGRQMLGVFQLPGLSAVDWHLDPQERASAILPMALWLSPEVVMVDGKLFWLTAGMIPLGSFPFVFPVEPGPDQLSGLVPGFLALIDIERGGMSFYLDPAAGPIARTWADHIGALIAAPDSLPASLSAALPYPAQWLSLQLEALQTNGVISLEGPTNPVSGAPVVWDAARPTREIVAGNGILALVRRKQGKPQWMLDSTFSRRSLRLEAERAFAASPELTRIRDSITAVGDTVAWGAIRWWKEGKQLLAWRPLFALNSQGVSLRGVGTLKNGALRVSRGIGTVADSVPTSRVDDPGEENPRLREARHWLALADSALRRGDLTAFGRYFEALQRILNASDR